VEARKRQGKIEGAQNLIGALGELGSLVNPGNWTKKSDSNDNDDGDGDGDDGEDKDVASAAAAVINTTANALKDSDYGYDYDSPEHDSNWDIRAAYEKSKSNGATIDSTADIASTDPAPTDEIGAANEEAITKNLVDLHETGTEQITKAVESGTLTPEEGAAKLKELNDLMDESAKKNKEAHDRSKTAAERIEAQNELSKAMNKLGAMIGALFNRLLHILTLGKYGNPGAPDDGANTNGAGTPAATTAGATPKVATPAATLAGVTNAVTKVAPTEVPTEVTPGVPPEVTPDAVTKHKVSAKVPTKNKRGM
jgi:hypothetical protein